MIVGRVYSLLTEYSVQLEYYTVVSIHVFMFADGKKTLTYGKPDSNKSLNDKAQWL